MIIADISQWYFLPIAPAKRPLLASEPLFGGRVHGKFPDVASEIASAARCLAYGESTASVFHLMRVTERALHALGRHLEITTSDTIELQNMRNIIDQIESKIRSMEKEQKTPERSARLQAYSEIAAQFWFFKEAWRNHVAHARSTYTESQAFTVYRATAELMQKLVEIL